MNNDSKNKNNTLSDDFISKNEYAKIHELLSITEKLNHVKDIDSLLDNILYQTRVFTKADAGSIFLVNTDNALDFSYFQNETLGGRDENSNRHIYSNFSIPINDKSIAGYVANTGDALAIDDVYFIPEKLPYSFNKSFDELSMYRTKSVLTVPLITSREQIIGVMQIINAMNKDKNIVPFDENDILFASFFANNASVAIERAKMTREMVLRMIKMAELRDPKETGNHVNRVGAYSIEIYERWAKNRGIKYKEIAHYKDILRIAAMLHDVGKVAISDTILKKPAKFTDEEYEIMKTHTTHGEELFGEKLTEMDKLSFDVAGTHHEKWNGKGYPKGLKGEEIPLGGRIVAIADVFDALISKRVYKDAFEEEKVLKILREESGEHFDPELIDAFFSIYDVITAIRNKYSDI